MDQGKSLFLSNDVGERGRWGGDEVVAASVEVVLSAVVVCALRRLF